MSLSEVLTNRDDPPVEPAPRWRTVLAFVLSLAGLGIAIYLTVDHFAKVAPACSDTGAINCLKVTTSTQSYFPPGGPLRIPVAVLGLAFYAVMVVINSPWAWKSTDRRVHLARLILVAAGVGFALYLVSAELIIIHAICLWCTSVHVVTFFLLVLVLATVPGMLGWGTARGDWDGPDDGDDEYDEGEYDEFDPDEAGTEADEDGDEPVGVDAEPVER